MNASGKRCRGQDRGFTLLEVLIAFAVFFIAIFAILGLVSRSLSLARHLTHADADIGSLASAISMTSPLQEGDLPLEVQTEFEESHPGFSCSGSIAIAGTNGLLRVDLEVRGPQAGGPPTTMSFLLYRPETGNSGASLGRGAQ